MNYLKSCRSLVLLIIMLFVLSPSGMANPVPIKELPELLKRIQAVSWLSICDPIVDDLVYLKVPYWGFDDTMHEGELVVHKAVAPDLIDIFNQLAQHKFPIKSIQTIDRYDNNDERSMADNNTSAFNCRAKTMLPDQLSNHAKGIAIDINPRMNPFIKGDNILPENGKTYTDRTQEQPGMITENSLILRLFREKGWIWGGDWTSLKDYQHFEKPSVLKNHV